MEKPPVARIEIARDTYFGTTIEDPYRWLEDWQSRESQMWLNGQAEYARQLLVALPAREVLTSRIDELSEAGQLLYGFNIAGGRYFYLRRDTGDNVPKLVVRTSQDAPEKVLLNPNAMPGDVHTVIDWFYPSHDGKLLAYGLSQGGSEESTLYILDVDTGATLSEAITRTRFGSVSWLEDNRSFFYCRLPEPVPGALITERYHNLRSYWHNVGQEAEQDVAMFGRGVNSNVEIALTDFLDVKITKDSGWVIGVVIHGVLNERTLYATPIQALIADPVHCAWQKIADIEDAVTKFEVDGDLIYLCTHKDAPRYKIIATSLQNPELATAQVIVPPSQAVIQDLMLLSGYLLTRDLEAGIGRVRRIKLDGGQLEQVSLPYDGTISEWASNESGAELLLHMTGWTQSNQIFRYDLSNHTLMDTGWQPASPIDFSDIESQEVFAPSKDGTLIPLSIIYRRGLKLDGNNPTLLAAYGSYGLIAYPPSFMPMMKAWYERGGVFAVAHVRGGGEYGKEWHLASYKLSKQNTVDDVIACAEYLVKAGYTRPEKLAGEGTSAGGIPSGGALTQRPDLFAVMVVRVAVTNFLRFEFSENGPPNVPEFGSVTTEDGFKGLQIMDSYTKIRDGVNYPAVLLTAGVNDPRVVVWQPAKMTARLQAATASSKPVILRVEIQAGHGMGSTRQQLNEELADKLAFLLQQFGEE